MHPLLIPTWVWIVLSLPTIGSLTFGAGLLAYAAIRDRRRRRHVHAGAIMLEAPPPDAAHTNGGISLPESGERRRPPGS